MQQLLHYIVVLLSQLEEAGESSGVSDVTCCCEIAGHTIGSSCICYIQFGELHQSIG